MMKKTTVPNGIKNLLITTAIGWLALSQFSQAETIGILGLFQATNKSAVRSAVEQLEKDSVANECVLRREGMIINDQGTYELGALDSFILIECERSLLSNGKFPSLLKRINAAGNNSKFLEGPINQFGHLGLSEPGAGRSYIIKLSDYNNISPQQRETELLSLSAAVGHVKDHYNAEASIHVVNAQGMSRPDDVTVIYYNSSESGNKFRENNPDYMTRISHFNEKHLRRFSYLEAVSNR